MNDRNKLLTLKVSEQEKIDWKCAAEERGLTLSDYIRASVGSELEGRAPISRRKRDTYNVDPLLLGEINKIGSNLNQIGRWCNTYKDYADVEQVLGHLIALERQLNLLMAEGVRFAY